MAPTRHAPHHDSAFLAVSHPTKPRVLIAVANRDAWSKHQTAFPRELEVVIVESAREALDKLSRQGPFAVIVTELRVLGMSGLDLLQAARQHMPDSARILVVDADDREAAIEAINKPHVLAFFVQPFASEPFVTALREGVARNQRRLHGQAVMLQTAEGVVQMLSGQVHPANAEPEIPAGARQLRDRARLMAQALRLPTRADLETAALLSWVGLSAMPHHVLEKLRAHEKLAPPDLAILERLPDVGLRLVEPQPHFAGVADVFRQQGVDPGPAVIRDDGVREHKVALSARILRAVVDLQLYELAGLTIPAALIELRKHAVRYDVTVLKALEHLFAGPDPATNTTFEECLVPDLVVGNILATDALSHEGVALVAAGTSITQTVLDHLKNFADLGEIVEPLYVLRTETPASEKSAPAT